MIPRECKRLAEVDFPLAEVSKHALAEKARRMGTPHQLHLWWAIRPLASSRAVLMALLLPDPCDEHCPTEFKEQARQILSELRQPPKTDVDLQKALLWFIGSFANWDLSTDPTYLRVARNLVQAAHPGETPLVVDPFAGGGSIPLEALRFGCEAFATDLNPVAGLILKSKLDDIQRFGSDLPEELLRVGGEIRAAAENELADLYPVDPDGAIPIAYLWARTVRCESPNCGAEIPLLRSLWLCKKATRRRALRTKVVRPIGELPQVEFEIFEPASDGEVAGGTVALAKASCLCCGMVLSPERVRAQLAAQKGGADTVFDEKAQRTGGAWMTAVVIMRPGEQGRHYRLPTDTDYAVVHRAQEWMAEILAEWEHGGNQGLCPVPDEPLPPIGTLGFRVQRYGMLEWDTLFTRRQALSFTCLSRIIREKVETESTPGKLASLLAMICSKLTDRCNSLVNWSLGVECVNQLFKGNAVPMAWDFAECNFLSTASGSFYAITKTMADNARSTLIPGVESASQTLADATDSPLPDQSASVWFTDPPYYDAIPYSDLSDFFLVWLKRTLPDHPLLRDPFDPDNPLSPKTREAVQDATKECDGRIKDRDFFEDTMGQAFSEGFRILREDGIGSVVFAHKTTEGWEALLSGIIRGGWTITGSWPIATERAARMRARDSAALATSVHLICRPRLEDAPIGDWADVLRELPVRVAAWIERLQGEGIRGADLVFACIGPALEIFSRYRAVETAEGGEIGLPTYLEKVWEVVGRTALERVLGGSDADVGALEEDARLTALFLWTMQSTDTPEANDQQEDDGEAVAKVAAKGFSLPFDVVRRFAQPMGIDLDVWTNRIIGQEKGVVRLLPVAERAKALFGQDGATAAAEWIEQDPVSLQLALFPDMEAASKPTRRRRGGRAIIDDELQSPDATTLDRVHAAMLLQASGQANALNKLLISEQDRGSDFLHLANALSALYPMGAEEKRLLDAMLLAVPR